MLQADQSGRTYYQELGIGNNTYGSEDGQIPGLMGECIALLVGGGKINEWYSSKNLSKGSKKMYESLKERADQPDSKFIVRKSLPFPMRPVQYRVYSK